MNFNPSIGLPEAIALAFVMMAGGSWLAWRGSAAANPKLRVILVVLRTIALILVALLWLNPGRWLEKREERHREWLVLVDRSASMGTEQETGKSRWDKALETVAQIAPSGRSHVKTASFSGALEESLANSTAGADGSATSIESAVNAALDSSETVAGIVLLSDGRDTVEEVSGNSALRARARGTPVHVVPLGDGWGSRDLSVTASPRQVMALEGQTLTVSARVENRGLGKVRPSLSLSGPDGKEIMRSVANLDDDASQTMRFEVPSPVAEGVYTVRADAFQEEHISSNNSDSIMVSVLKSRVRVLLLEGAPYWDSKFLAQLLRNQDAVEILTVHRLNQDRYFRIESTGSEPLTSPGNVFPTTAGELSRYDLIVFGKGAEGFMDAERLQALRGFVRDQGGAILFARGKSYHGEHAGLEVFDPVEWGESSGGSVRFVPDNESGGALFGIALPSGDDAIWETLPPLEDVRAVSQVKPFSRVLAHGVPSGRGGKIPLLIARRMGRGMTAAMNADGLWRWDFRPDIRDKTGVYQQFWIQLMLWCATYSDFRPGEDYAVRSEHRTVAPGQGVRVFVSHRGKATENKPYVRVYRDGRVLMEAEAVAMPGAESGQEYAAVFTPADAGRYILRVADRSVPALEQGEAIIDARGRPGEKDDLRPDRARLERLAKESGGRLFTLDESQELAGLLSQPPEGAVSEARTEWKPIWPQWWVACVVCGVFGAEWWIRRREGLS